MFNIFHKKNSKEDLKEKIVKGGTNMANDKEEIEDLNSSFDSEMMDDEQLEEETKPIQKKARPKASENPARQEPIKQAPRYESFHQTQVDGVIDTFSKKVVSTDIWEMLAVIKNDLEEIKRCVGV